MSAFEVDSGLVKKLPAMMARSNLVLLCSAVTLENN